MSNYVKYEDKIIYHPGFYIQEMLDENGLTPVQFAKMIGVTADEVRAILDGKHSVTSGIARRLSEVTGTSMSYWTNLQKAYDDGIKDIT